MKIASLALVLTTALAASTVACSSEGEAKEVSTASAVAELRSPTGSFSKATAGKAFGGYRTQKADGAALSSKTNGSGSSKPGSLRIRDASATGGSQACPAGGSVAYSAEQSAEGQLLKIGFTNCRFEDGEGFDGNALLLVSQKSLVDLGQASADAKGSSTKKPATGSGSSDDSFGEDDGSSGVKEAQGKGAIDNVESGSVLLAFKGATISGSKRSELSLSLYVEASYTFLAVTVPDGKVVIGVADDGRAIVKSKEGTWHCSETSDRWSCTSEKGEELQVAEEASSGSASSGSSDSENGSHDGSSSSSDEEDFGGEQG